MSLGDKRCPHCGTNTADSHQPSKEIERAEFYKCYTCGLEFWINRETIPEGK